jgi:hypothetical protein
MGVIPMSMTELGQNGAQQLGHKMYCTQKIIQKNTLSLVLHVLSSLNAITIFKSEKASSIISYILRNLIHF